MERERENERESDVEVRRALLAGQPRFSASLPPDPAAAPPAHRHRGLAGGELEGRETLHRATRSLPQILPPLPTTTEALSRKQARTSRGQREVTPPVQATSGKRKRSLGLTPDRVSPWKAQAASDTGPEAARVSAQAGSHQEKSREQKFASCSGLGFRILPAGAGAGRGRTALAAELLLKALAGRLEGQSHRGPLLGRQNHLLQGVEHWCSARPWPPLASRSAPLLVRPGAVGAPAPRDGQADPVRGYTQVWDEAAGSVDGTS